MGRFLKIWKGRDGMNFYNDKTRRKIAAAIVVLLVIAMVLPLLAYAL